MTDGSNNILSRATRAAATTAALLTLLSACSGHSGAQHTATPSSPTQSSPAQSSPAATTPADSPSPSPSPSAPATPSGTASRPTDDGKPVPVTAPALLTAVVQSLPAGLTADHFEINPPSAGDPYPSVYAQVHTPAGTGQIGVSMYPSNGPLNCSGDTTCRPGPAGDQVQVQHEAGNCIQHTVVTVRRHEGFTLAVQISSCLFAGNVPAVPALTEDQAATLGSNPVIQTEMPASYVQAAAAKYPNLPLV